MAHEKKAYPYGSFFRLPNALFGDKHTRGWVREIGPTGLLVYALVARRYDHRRGRGIYESHASMARTLGITTPTLRDHLDRLYGVGLIDRVSHGRKRHEEWVYVPRVPVPEPAEKDVSDGVIRKTVFLMEGGLGKMTALIRKNDRSRPNGDVAKTKGVKVDFRGANRLFLTDSIKSPENLATEVSTDQEVMPLKTQVQTAWRYWCGRWEEKYGQPYYASGGSGPAKLIARDKKNLRDRIEAVGFDEVMARMGRCFEVCDEMFPCRVRGKWQRPIRIDDFVRNDLFNQWIVPRNVKSRGVRPRSLEERLAVVCERQASYGNETREVDERCGEDSKPYRPTSAGNENSSDKS